MKKGGNFYFVLLLAFLLPVTTPAVSSAAFQQIKVTDGSSVAIPAASADITVPAGLTNTPAIEVSGKGGAVSTTGVLRITTEGVQTGGTSGTQGIYVNADKGYSASVALGETHISAHGTAITASKAGSSVTLGDNSTIASENLAISAGSGATITVGNGAKIIGNSYGASSAALSASGAAKVKIGSNAVIGNDAKGTGTGNRIAVLAHNTEGDSSGYAQIGDQSTIYSKGTGEGSSAVVAGYVSPATGEVLYSGNIRIGQSADISTVGDKAIAVWGRHTDSSIEIGDGSMIRADGKNSSAVRSGYVFSLKTTAGGTITLGERTNVMTKEEGSYGLDARGAGSNIVLGAGSSVTTAGKSAHAAYVTGGGTVDIKNGTVTTAGKGAHAAYVTGTNSVLNIGAGSALSTMSDDSHALYAAVGNASAAVSNDVALTSKGKGAHGVYISGSNVVVSLGENATVKTSGSKSHALYVSTGTLRVDDGASLSTEGSASHGAYANNKAASIEFKGDAAITVNSADSYALYANAGKITSRQDAAGEVVSGGKFTISGDVKTGKGASIDLMMTDDSYFLGKTEAGDGSLVLDMTGTTWDVTQSSDLTALKLNDSVVNLGFASSDTMLCAGDLSAGANGGGTFIMKTDVVAGTGDLLSADTSSGAHTISIANSGSDATDGTETLTVVETGDGIAEFSMDNDVEIGAWLYGLRRTETDANNWELYSTGSSHVASAAVNTFSGAYLLSYAETQTLMQRLGDLRDTPYLSGFWFRVYGGKFESNSSSFVRGFDMDYGGVQVGYDRKIENNWKGGTYVGGYFGYSKGDLDYSTEHGNTGGNGKVDSKTLGAYATYVQEDGFYADALVKYMWMKNDFDVLDTDGDRVTGGDLSTGGLGISLELGKRFRMAKNEKGGNWYIEPQIQYSYTHQDGGHYYASNGLRIGVDSFTSSMGRLGVLVGYETAKTNFYAKASFVKEFDGDVNIVANDVNIPESFSDSWWVYGLGFTSRLNDRNSIYMSLERSDGGKFDEPWKVYAGWRISF